MKKYNIQNYIRYKEDVKDSIERIGKKHVSNVIHIESTDLEYKMYERLKNKQKLQGLLLDLIQKETR